ncbi:MAG: 16S rRNA (guanine(966)-N(2))-methyltransferase RsmD [Rickettsiales bacterium]|nr:MAG: 16S rRNA (guanine(966)-N(2))-methyltransferase RsmD [Rickettsiales bacterium]
MIRIIAGKHKNRVIPTLKKADYRPSTTKFREALFSILSSGEFAESQPVTGATLLDLFAGTGALSFEALSRGAGSITLIDSNETHLKLAKEFAAKIGEEDNVTTLTANALLLPKSITKYDLVFMDPPYYNDMVAKSLKCLIKRDWLANGALIAIEMSARERLDLLDGLILLKEKRYGNNKLLILKYEQS